MSEVGLAVQDFVDHGMVRKLLPVVEGEGVQFGSMLKKPLHDYYRDRCGRSIKIFRDDRKTTVTLNYGEKH